MLVDDPYTTTPPSATQINHVFQQVSTTTIYPNGTAAPIKPEVPQTAPIPVGAIVGGIVGGVILAVVVVAGWVWWGKSIKRTQAKERREILKALQVRENTRRNASSSNPSVYTHAPSRREKPRKVSFVPPSTASSNQSTLKASPSEKSVNLSAGPFIPQHKKQDSRTPKRPSPLAQTIVAPLSSPVPPVPPIPSPPSPTSPFSDPLDPLIQPRSLGNSAHFMPRIPALLHKASSLSSGSRYSTQSGEDRQRVPPSLIAAALGHIDGRRPPSSYSYIPGADNEHSRLSQISAGSAGLQPEDIPDVPIGYAYGGEYVI